MKTYNINFIRHGEFSEAKSGSYIGITDVPISEKGKKDLKLLSERYNYPYSPIVFTSPLKRCTETCKILFQNTNPIVINDLTECNFGEWEGKTGEDLNNDEDFKKWLAGDSSIKPPKGESSADFTRRICRAFEDIVKGLLKTGSTQCSIVTHGGVIMTLLAVYGLPQAKPFEWSVDNGFGYSMRINTMLWQRDKVAEVYRRIPLEKDKEE